MSDDFTRGFLEGVEVAARIFRNHIGGIRPVATEPTMGLGRPESARDDTGAASMENHPPDDPEPAASAYPADHPQPMVVWTPPTVGFYRLPLPEDRSES